MNWIKRKIIEAVGEWLMKESIINQPLTSFIGGRAQWIPSQTREYIQRGYLFNTSVYSCTEYIVKKGAGVPWFTERKTGDGWERVDGHPATKLINHPNPQQSRKEYISNVLGFKVLTGNSYQHGVGPTTGSNAGQVRELWPMAPQLTRVIIGDWKDPVQGYLFGITKSIKLENQEVLHIKDWNPDYDESGSHVYGMSRWKSAARTLTRANDGVTASVRMLQNMSSVGFLARTDVDSHGKTQEQVADLQKSIKQSYGGPWNRGKFIATAGNYQWIQLGLDLTKLEIRALAKMDLRDICNICGLNSAIFNDEDNKVYNNVRDARKAGWTDAIIPELNDLRDGWNKFIVPKEDQDRVRVSYDLSEVPELQEDSKERSERLANSYWLTLGEKRKADGFDIDPNQPELMDSYHIPFNLQEIGEETDEERETRALIEEARARANGA